MRAQLRPALVVLLLMTALTGVLYPFVMTGLAGALFPRQAHGSLLLGRAGTPIGSTLIAQVFTGPGYFHSRPSAAAPDASLSSGSNLGPTSPLLADSLNARAVRLRAEHLGAATGSIPVDLITASASGLDPDLSPDGARWQAARIATARNIPVAILDSLVAVHTERRLWGLFGEPRVNVLLLDLALDSLASTPSSH
jgi:K+-transporting ATPase ATPase C chain